MTEGAKAEQRLRLNLGCGNKHMADWLNVDSMPDCSPDLVCDLEQFPWPWADDSVERVMLSHVLEHLGQARDVFLGIISELYRVCCHGAQVLIVVPHPRHDTYWTDPTHVRPILVETLQMFDQELNRRWIEARSATTPLGLYLGVDFRIRRNFHLLDPVYRERHERGELTAQQVQELVRTHNNVCQEIQVEWIAHKEPRAAPQGPA